MQLVGQFDSPYVRRVAISLHLLGLPFTRNTISVFSDAEEMGRINPLVRVPSLVLDDGEVLIDSGAILDHIDETVGAGRALLPQHGTERRRALRIIALASGAIDKAGAIVYERVLRPADKVYEPWIDRCRAQLTGALRARCTAAVTLASGRAHHAARHHGGGNGGIPALAPAGGLANRALSERRAAVRGLRGAAGLQGHGAGARRDDAV
jgi:hypothetical protein